VLEEHGTRDLPGDINRVDQTAKVIYTDSQVNKKVPSASTSAIESVPALDSEYLSTEGDDASPPTHGNQLPTPETNIPSSNREPTSKIVISPKKNDERKGASQNLPHPSLY
jgi:hypothetical protein